PAYRRGPRLVQPCALRSDGRTRASAARPPFPERVRSGLRHGTGVAPRDGDCAPPPTRRLPDSTRPGRGECPLGKFHCRLLDRERRTSPILVHWSPAE